VTGPALLAGGFVRRSLRADPVPGKDGTEFMEQNQIDSLSNRRLFKMTDLVCAWCDVDARVPCETRDDQGRVAQTWTKCAYCGRTELKNRVRGGNGPQIREQNQIDR
jgi:hypothetical protein